MASQALTSTIVQTLSFELKSFDEGQDWAYRWWHQVEVAELPTGERVERVTHSDDGKVTVDLIKIDRDGRRSCI